MRPMKKMLRGELDFYILVGIVLTVLLTSAFMFGGSIYSVRNIQSMAFQIPEFGFLALAMMLSNMIGGIDLSIIANANTVAIFAANVMSGTVTNYFGIICCCFNSSHVWAFEWNYCGKDFCNIFNCNIGNYDFDSGYRNGGYGWK